MAVIGGRNVGTNDLVVMGAGALMFIDSFLPWYGIKIAHFPGSNASGWSAGFGAWFSVLLVVAVAGVVAARVFGGRAMPPVAGGSVSWPLILGGVSVLAVLIILLRWVTFPDGAGWQARSSGCTSD